MKFSEYDLIEIEKLAERTLTSQSKCVTTNCRCIDHDFEFRTKDTYNLREQVILLVQAYRKLIE